MTRPVTPIRSHGRAASWIFHFHLRSPGGADPRRSPGDINVVDDLVTFGFISTAPRVHALEKLNTFRVRGVRILVLVAVLCHREGKEAATLRVVGVPNVSGQKTDSTP
jgi:hypothetical protein